MYSFVQALQSFLVALSNFMNMSRPGASNCLHLVPTRMPLLVARGSLGATVPHVECVGLTLQGI